MLAVAHDADVDAFLLTLTTSDSAVDNRIREQDGHTGSAMGLKTGQQPALTHQERVQRLHQLTTDLAKAVDLAEEQRRILRDLSRDASELAGEVVVPARERGRRKR